MNRVGGQQHGGGPLRLNIARVRVPLSAVLAAWCGRRVGGGLAWLARHPLAFTPLVLMWLAFRIAQAFGPLPIIVFLAVVVGCLVWWRRRSGDSFTRQVSWRWRGLWRGQRLYRFAWQPAMVTTGLMVRSDSSEYLPKIRSVRSTGSVDQVRVRMLPGQTLEDWAEAAPRLAATFGARECRVRSVESSRHELVLWFLINDPLTNPVPPFAAAVPVDFAALEVARREDGLVYRLKVLGSHLLLVGATGSGKSSVIWSIINGLGPAIRESLAQVWALDPKGGMELASGRRLFARFVYGDPDDGSDYELDFARVLEEAVTVMRRRQAALRGVTRLHTPTMDEPLIVIIVDEMAALTAYVQDRDAKKRIASALSLLLSQGRAVGVTVVGAVQDPRKDVVSVRDLFPTRIALRLSEAEQVSLVLGNGARNRGARCDQIPESSPGVGYVAIDGVAEPIRVRFSFISDGDINQLVEKYAPRGTASAEIAA